MRVTDGQMDGQIYHAQDRASIAALRSKNYIFASVDSYLDNCQTSTVLSSAPETK